MNPAPPITEKQALEECLKMWRWLEKNPGKAKHDYIKTCAPHLQAFECHCPCCEYVCQKHPQERSIGMTCAGNSMNCDYRSPELNGCPLAELWPNGCTNGVFGIWSQTRNFGELVYYAKQIADACEARLKEFTETQPNTETKGA